MNPLWNGLAGLLCGILSGCGIGGGSLLLLWLTAAAGIARESASAINLLYFLPTAGASLLLHQKHRLLRWRIVLPAALAGCACAVPAAMLTGNLATGYLKKLMGVFWLLIGLRELKQAFSRSTQSASTGRKSTSV